MLKELSSLTIAPRIEEGNQTLRLFSNSRNKFVEL